MSSPAPGEKLGHYQILAPIGAGGMGVVYRARDTRLGRDVAIKISSEEFTDRFEREARTIASLNHPGICTLHDVGPNYLVMELVEGPTLAERIRSGPIPIAEVLVIARQIAEALDAAHEKGVVHRDLKPGNVKITLGGIVKVLDFGLAKTSETSPASAAESPTYVAEHTEAGVVLGTAAYMSPEQARGARVDKRTDIWAFGVVLWEMATGSKLFPGQSASDSLAAVLTLQPEWERIPAALRPLLQRCLQRDPKSRLRDIADAAILLETVPAATRPASRSKLPGIAAVWFAAAAAVALWAPWRPAFEPELFRFQISAPENTAFESYAAISPNGRRLAFNAQGSDGVLHLWIRDLDTLQARMLPGTEGAGGLFWSPDSRSVAFATGRQLKKVDALGTAPPQTLCESEVGVGAGDWNEQDIIIFGGRGGGPIQQVSARGGIPSAVTLLDSSRQDVIHAFPSFLPDGRRFLYYLNAAAAGHQGIYVGSLDTMPQDQDSRRLLATQHRVLYAQPQNGGKGQLLSLREGTLLAQPFDPSSLEFSGEAIPVAEQVGSTNSLAFFSVSDNGVLVHRSGTAGTSKFTWVDSQGKPQGTLGEAGMYVVSFSLSPNGATLATGRDGVTEIWLLDVERGVSTRFTTNPALENTPVWSPDSQSIVFRSNRKGRFDLYQKNVNSTEEHVLLATENDKRPTSWSREGLLLYDSRDPVTKSDLWVLPVKEGGMSTASSILLKTMFNESSGTFAPNGPWIAYVSDESGRDEVYLRGLSASSSSYTLTGDSFPVSRDGGSEPFWQADGKKLFYRSRNGNLMAVQVNSEHGSLRPGVPASLFAVPPTSPSVAVTASGSRFLYTIPQPTNSAPFSAVLNWQTMLQKKN